jgi:hypothetical protein
VTAGRGSGPEGGPPAPLVLSIVAGAVGLVLLVAGAVAGSTALSVAGVVAGTASLGAALYWRSLLISAWAAQKQGSRRRSREGPGAGPAPPGGGRQTPE